ncbi:hypothetical protein HY375_01315 [Candidatus Berkelbacteria bacterium]|nr:hypothetical protein [Candidatus Berkelbacteria bacterium]
MTIAIILHVIGTVLGAGAVTINDLTLVRAIGDGDIGVAYQKSARAYTLLVWLGLVLILGSALYMALSTSWVMQSEKVLTKLFLVAVLTINGVLMGRFLLPRIDALTKADWQDRTPKLRTLVLAGVFPGALSVTSWYTTLILGAAGRQAWTPEQMLGWYLIALGLVWAVASLTVKWRLRPRS